jgi:hypothetical protein
MSRTYSRGLRTRRSVKEYDPANTMKGVTALRKSLIDAQRQAMLACDELEDAQFNVAPPTVDSMSSGDDNGLDAAIQAAMGIAECITKAIDFSNQMKDALRGSIGNGMNGSTMEDPAIGADDPNAPEGDDDTTMEQPEMAAPAGVAYQSHAGSGRTPKPAPSIVRSYGRKSDDDFQLRRQKARIRRLAKRGY